MKDTIRDIINIDKKARQAVSEAMERKAGSVKAVEEKKQEVSEAILAKARTRVELIRAMEMEDAEQQWQESREKYARVADSLNESLKKNKETWVNNIVDRVINGD